MDVKLLQSPGDVLDFWFGTLDASSTVDQIESRMGMWFASTDPEFDHLQKANSQLIDVTADQDCDECWKTPAGSLARVIVLDQFSRCVYRGTKRAFEYDVTAACIVKDIIDKGWLVSEYAPIQRLFLGVAAQHSEDIAMQMVGLEIAKLVAAGSSDEVKAYIANLKGYPNEHFEVVQRFNRFPSRNLALGRDSTLEEIEWMQSPQCPDWAKSQTPLAASPLLVVDPPAVINVGVIAFGLSGRVFHAPFLLTHPCFNMVAVCERSKNEGEKFATAHGHAVATVRSVEELVCRSDISLVVVCSPIEFHYTQARQALDAGKHVLVEKAFCATAAQAHDLLLYAKEKGLVCMPYQNRRFDSDFLTLQRIIQEHRLGDIVEYNGYFNRYSPRIRDGVWKDTVVGSGGNFLSLGSHMVDQAVLLFGPPSRVWADIRCQRTGGVLDDAWEVHLFYESNGRNVDAQGLHMGGFRAILKGSLLCADHNLRYMIHGTHGSWVKRGIDTQEGYLMSGKLPVYRPKNGCSGDDNAAYGREEPSQWGVLTVAGEEEVRTRAELGCYHSIYDDLYSRIIRNSERHDNIDTNLDLVPVVVLKVIELAKRSSRTGAAVDFSLDD